MAFLGLLRMGRERLEEAIGNMRSQGFITLAVLLTLFLAAGFVAVMAVQRYYQAERTRMRAATQYLEAQALTRRADLDKAILTLGQEARTWAASHLNTSGWAFGDGTQTGARNALAPLASHLQSQADALLCGSQDNRIRLYFTTTACGVPLDDPADLPPITLETGTANTLQTYKLPFLAFVDVGLGNGEFRVEQRYSGALTLRAGTPNVAEFQAFLATGYSPGGAPAYFSGGQVFSGPVHVSGVPNFGYSADNSGPFFLDAFSTARCGALSPTGCAGGQASVGFRGVGNVPPEDMYPTPFNPCYNTSCPVFSAGVDWNAPAAVPPRLDDGGVEAPEVPDDASALLTVTDVGGNPAQQLEITSTALGSTTLIFQGTAPTSVWVRASSGGNLAALANWSRYGWTNTVSQVTGGTITLTDRDGYWGAPFPVSPGETFTVSFEGNADAASGPLQVGFRFTTPSGYVWQGTRWGGTGGGVSPGDGWKTVSGSVTVPNNATEATIWIQIDAPWGSTGTAYFRNLKVSPPSERTVPLPTMTAGALVRFGGALRVAGSQDASVASNTGLTLAAQGSITIEGNLLPTEPACLDPGRVVSGEVIPPNCPAYTDPASQPAGALGLYTANGNVLVGRNAPGNLYVAAAILAPNGYFGPENALTGFQGTFAFLGSFASFNFLSFEDAATGQGWQLHAVFDPRFARGVRPPYWPALPRAVWFASATYGLSE